MAKWEKKALKTLIQAYQHYSCLYDVKSPDYFKRNKNKDALEAIVEIVRPFRPETTTAEIKMKLRSLRCQFMREYKRVVSSRRSGADIFSVYTPKFWWYHQLYFLRHHIKRRIGQEDIKVEEDDDDDEWEIKKTVPQNEFADFGNFVAYTMSRMTKSKAQKLKHAIMRLIIDVENEEDEE